MTAWGPPPGPQLPMIAFGERPSYLYYWDTNWYDYYWFTYNYHHFTRYIYDFPGGKYIGRLCVTNTPIKVIGIAAPVWIGKIPVEYIDSTMEGRLPEFFKLYQQENGQYLFKASTRWDTVTPQKWMELYQQFINPDTANLYEAYFEKPVIVHDTFYVGGTMVNNLPYGYDYHGDSNIFFKYAHLSTCYPIYHMNYPPPGTPYTFGTPNPGGIIMKNEWPWSYIYPAPNDTNMRDTSTISFYYDAVYDRWLPFFAIIDTDFVYDPCMDWEVLGLHTEGVVNTTTSLAWNADGMSNWLLSVRKADEDMDSGLLIETALNYVTLNELDSMQWYVAQVRTVCDTEYSGPWSDTIMFYVPKPSEVGNGCKKPTLFFVDTVYENGAIVQWNAASGVTWEVEYGAAETPLDEGSLVWAPLNYTLCIGQPATWYWARVRTVCAADWKSDWTDTVMFYLPAPDNCKVPTDFHVNKVHNDIVWLEWNEGPDTLWEVELAKAGTALGDGQLLLMYNGLVIIGGLDSMSWYWARVRTVCDSETVTGWTDTVSFFVTGYNGSGIADPEGQYTRLMPNPAREEVTVMSSALIREVELYSTDGKLLQRKEVNAESTTLSLDGLPAGVYFVRIHTAAGVTTQRLVVE